MIGADSKQIGILSREEALKLVPKVIFLRFSVLCSQGFELRVVSPGNPSVARMFEVAAKGAAVAAPTKQKAVKREFKEIQMSGSCAITARVVSQSLIPTFSPNASVLLCLGYTCVADKKVKIQKMLECLDDGYDIKILIRPKAGQQKSYRVCHVAFHLYVHTPPPPPPPGEAPPTQQKKDGNQKKNKRKQSTINDKKKC